MVFRGQAPFYTWRKVRMLVFSRKENEWICIGDNIRIYVVGIRGDKVRLGIEAPKEIPVHRHEVVERIAAAARESNPDVSD